MSSVTIQRATGMSQRQSEVRCCCEPRFLSEEQKSFYRMVSSNETIKWHSSRQTKRDIE